MLWLQQNILKNKGLLIAFIVVSILVGGAIIFQSFYIVKIVNAVFIENSSFASLLPTIWLLIAVVIARVLLTTSNSYLGVLLSSKVKQTIREQLLLKWQSNPLQSTLQGQSGSKVTMLIDLIDELESFYRDYIPQVIKSIIVPLMIISVIFYTHFYSGLILLITAPFIPLSYVIVGLQTRKKAERQLVELSTFSGKFLDLLQGLQTLKLFGQGKKQRIHLEASNKQFQKSTMTLLKTAFASTFFIEIVVTLGIGLVAIEIAFQMITFEAMTFAQAFFILALAPEFFNAIKDLGGAFHTGRSSLAAAELVQKELNHEEASVQWGTEEIPKNITLRLIDGGFSYGGKFKMKQLNITIEKGEQVAIIGPTGQGKTTLLNILAGVYDLQEGEVIIGDKRRALVDQQQWFQRIAYISQNPYLFAGTIAENIQMAKGQCDEKALKEALEKAQLDEWLQELPDGFNTSVGEAGRGLSGGEKQRIALARAFYKKPQIVFFDEPTMGLDLKTERAIQIAIERLAQQTTMVTVAHRMHTIYNADKIILLDQGVIQIMGTHEELKNTNDQYQQMIGGQSS